MSSPTVRGVFPFPIPVTTTASDVGVGTCYPIGLAYEQCVELFWRAKKIKMASPLVGKMLTGSAENAAGQYPQSDVVADFSTVSPTIDTSSKGDEIHALDVPFVWGNSGFSPGVANPSIPSNHSDPGTTPPPGFPDYYFGTYNGWIWMTIQLGLFDLSVTYPHLTIPIIGNVYAPRIVEYLGKYYPAMHWHVRMDMVQGFDHVPPPVSPYYYLSYWAEYDSSQIISGGAYAMSGSLFGVDIGALGFSLSAAPVRLGGLSPGPGIAVTGFSTINMAITEWWPFDPKDGRGPFYDTSTGNFIR